MKILTPLVLLSTLVFQLTAFAKSQPVSEEVTLTNGDFSKAIYEALEKTKKPKKAKDLAGGEMMIIDLKGFSCNKHTSKKPSGTKVGYSCTLAANSGWTSMGMNTYGSGSSPKLSKALYNALSVPAEVDEVDGVEMSSTKTIQMDFKDDDGGTQRNQLSCVDMGEETVKMGFNEHVCSIINAL